MRPVKKYILMIMAAAAVLFLQTVACACGSTDYIVKLRPGSDIAKSRGVMELRTISEELGLYVTNDISALDPEMIEYAEEDIPVELFGTYDYSNIENTSRYSITGVKSMWDAGIYGRNVRIGVVDSGCSAHFAFGGNLCAGVNVIDGSADMSDNVNHGTAVCGVAAGSYGFGYPVGTAHKASVVPVKFIDVDAEGNMVAGTISYLAKGIITAVDELECDVINVSSGLKTASSTLKNAVDYAVSKGVTVVAAVGNNRSSVMNYPAAYDNVIGVGSVSGQKVHSSYSNTNTSVYVAAPGESMRLLKGNGSSFTASGTSFSAPYVSGIVADMLEIAPELTSEEIMEILSSQAEDLGDEGYDTSYGWGLVRADRIIGYLLNGSGCFMSDTDICTEDGFSEVRVTIKEGSELPMLVMAEYDNREMKQVSLFAEQVAENTFMLRMKPADDSQVKCFAWDSFEKMVPIKTGSR